MNQHEYWALVARRETAVADREIARAERAARHVARVEAATAERDVDRAAYERRADEAATERWDAFLRFAFWVFVVTMTILIGGFIGGLMGVPIVVGIMVFGFLVLVFRRWK